MLTARRRVMTMGAFFSFLLWIHLSAVVMCANKTTLYIGALLPIGEDSRWVVKHAEVGCRLAVEHVNNHASLLEGYNLELYTNSSDCDVGIASYQLYEMLSSHQRKFVALIAEGCAIVTLPIAKTTQHFDMLQFNFLSSSPSLYNRTVHPYYYPLLPPETTLNYGRVALLEQLNWKDAIIVIETEEVFNLVASHLVSLLIGRGYNYEVYSVSADVPLTIDTAVENIALSDRRIIIGLFYEKLGRHLVCQAFQSGVKSPNYVWFFTGWFDSGPFGEWFLKENATSCSTEEMNRAVNGHFKFDFSQSANDSSIRLPTGKTRQDVEDEYKRRTGNATFEQYSAYGYDTVLSIALMLNETIKELKAQNRSAELDQFDYKNEKLRERFQGVLRQIEFNGMIGRIHFDSTADHSHERREATERIEINFHSQSSDFLVAIYNNGTNSLTLNNVGKIPWIGGKIPLAKVAEIFDYSNEKVFYVIAALAALGIVFALSMLAFNVRFRHRKVVKLSSPFMNNVVAIGAVMVYASIIFDGFNGQFYPLGNWSFVSCYLRNSLLAIGFSLSFGSMFAKTWRVSKIIKEANAGRSRSLFLTDKVLLTVVGVFVAIDALLLSLWYGINPFESGTTTIKMSEDARFVRELCSSPDGGHWLYVLYAYKGLILVLGVYLAYDTRRVRIVSLNDSRYIAMSVYNTVISCIIVFALSFVPNPGLQYALESTAIIVAVASILGFVFLPKVYWLINGRDAAKMKTFGRVGTKKSSGVNDHTIARTTDLLALQGRERRQSTVIRLLVDNGNFPEEVLQRVKGTLGDDYDTIVPTSPLPTSPTTDMTMIKENDVTSPTSAGATTMEECEVVYV